MLRFLKLRYLFLIALVWYGAVWFDARDLLRLPVENRFRSFFSAIGYPGATFDITHITLTRLTLENIVLDYDETGQDAINTIEKIEATYSPLDILFGNLDRVLVVNPALFFSADALPKLPDVTFDRKSFLTDLPVQDLEIHGLTASYAGDFFNPEVAGDIILNTTENEGKRILVTLKGEQKDFSVNLKISAQEEKNGPLSMNIDLSDFRIDIPEIFKIMRGTGLLHLTFPPAGSVAIDGKWAAGSTRIGNLSLDGIMISANGQKPHLNLIGNAAINGMPQSTFSIRLTEDQKGAQALFQLAGEEPQKLSKMAGLSLKLPEQQKFSLLLDLKDSDLGALLAPPYRGGFFVYQGDPDPFIRAQLSCTSYTQGCTLDIPTVPLPASAFETWFAPVLADKGLLISRADKIMLGGKFSGIKPGTPPKMNIEGALQNASVDWNGLSLTNANAWFSGSAFNNLLIGNFSAKTLDGTVESNRFLINPTLPENGGVLTFKHINLASLAPLTRIKDLDLSGSSDITIPLSFRNGTTLIHPKGTLRAKNGQINYTAKSAPPFLNGTDQRSKLIRDILKDYDFSDMTIEMEGPVGKTINARLSAKGKNLDLYGNQEILLDLKMNGALAPGLGRLIPSP